MSKSRQKGTSFETSLIPLLEEYFPGAMRRPLSGNKDKGDFYLPGATYALEAKNHKTMSLAEWVKESEVEAQHLGVDHGAVVHKRRGVTDPRKQYVTTTLGTWLDLTTR